MPQQRNKPTETETETVKPEVVIDRAPTANPELDVVSNVSGEAVTAPAADPEKNSDSQGFPVPAPAVSGALEKQAAAANAAVNAASADVREAGEKRKAAAVAGSPDRLANEIAGLLDERKGYVQRKLDDRVAQVDEQIRLRGGTPPKA